MANEQAPDNFDSPITEPILRTNPSGFVNPHSKANKIGRLLWGIVWRVFFHPTPSCLGAWRRFLLRLFGAKIGRAWLHQNVRVWAPWELVIGDDVYIDTGTNLYSAYGIAIADRVTISQGVFLCTASHDYRKVRFPLIGGKITVGSDVWIAADAFVAPGITISTGAVIGARAVVVRNVDSWTVVGGNPARVLKKRVLEDFVVTCNTAQ